jgi:hypothetical protein
MPNYFFDLHNDIEAPDEEGRYAPNPQGALTLAIAEVREMAAASITEHGHVDLAHYIQIRDETRAVVSKVHFDEVVTYKREGLPV